MSNADDKQKKRMSPERRRRMANAERQRRFYWKRKEERRRAADPTDLIAKRRFNEFLTDDDRIQIWTFLDWVGIDCDWQSLFKTDEDLSRDQNLDDEKDLGRGSIGHAEKAVSFLLDAATQLAAYINDYKKQEIDRAIADLEASGLSDPATRKQALAEIVRLTKMREQLNKGHRRTLPQWRVTAL
jgi:hypothetical protein